MDEKIYRHYKGGLYRLLFHATDAETRKTVVVYESLEDNRPYVRDWQDFHGWVHSVGKPRFTLVE